ncbi:proclotting enzyme-like [Planococcus citri]|uniref:proclotting enzyme-like n=1 Tax=Planococcus citri TaxID=170843 RepID=UPI0031F8F1BC
MSIVNSIVVILFVISHVHGVIEDYDVLTRQDTEDDDALTRRDTEDDDALTRRRYETTTNSCQTPDSLPGNCIVLKNCPHLHELLKKRGLEPRIVQFLRRSKCGTENNSPKVCCSLTNSVQPSVTSASVDSTPSSISSYVHQNPSSFWYPSHSSTTTTVKPSPTTEQLQTSTQQITSPKTLITDAYDHDQFWNTSPTGSPVTSSPGLITSSTVTHADRTKLHAKNKYATCGKSSRKGLNISGGKNATLGDWPWMVTLVYRTVRDPTPMYRCGGTLISDRWVLTAGHCVQYIGSLILQSVRVGDLNLDDKLDDGASPINIPVEKVIPHHGFTSTPGVTNDIALLRLKYPVNFTANVRPICISGKEEHRSDDFYLNRSAYIAGWGDIKYGERKTTDMLMEATVDIVDLKTCAKNYAGRYVTIDQRVLCASRLGIDACQGDSGGPLMMPIKNSYYLVGIISFGIGCADIDYPGVYTKVGYFSDWIRSTTGIEM